MIVGKILIEDAIFEGVPVRIMVDKYANGSAYKIYTEQFDSKFGMYIPYGIHTCNFPEILKKGEVAIKEYSEGTGSLAFLFAYDIVDHPHKIIETKFVTLPVCKLLVNIE